MRGLILAVVLGAALDAQAPKGSPEPTNPGPSEAAKTGSVFLTPEQARRFFGAVKWAPATPAAEARGKRTGLKAGQTCAIPLLNVLRRGNVDPKMILPAGPPVDARIRIVAPPAPSCDHRE